MRLPTLRSNAAATVVPSRDGGVELIVNQQHFQRVVVDGICRAKVSIDIMTADLKAMLVPDPRTRRSDKLQSTAQSD